MVGGHQAECSDNLKETYSSIDNNQSNHKQINYYQTPISTQY